MDKLTSGEARLYARWTGRDFINLEEYWEDVFKSMIDMDVPLPYRYNPVTVRMIHEMLKCPPGKCGICCNYPQVPLAKHDIKRMEQAGIKLPEIKQKEDGTLYFDCSNGCPFLRNNTCTIYNKYRPDACWLFPVQPKKDSELLFMRIKCKPAMDVIRKVITEAVKENNWLLLPNLICIEREAKNG